MGINNKQGWSWDFLAVSYHFSFSVATTQALQYLRQRVSTVKRVPEGVSGPGRKLSVCSMLKEEMETLEGAGREAHTTADEDRMRI